MQKHIRKILRVFTIMLFVFPRAETFLYGISY